MSDALPFFAAETGTYSTTWPSVNLSGTAASLGNYPSRTFASADADATTTFASGNTCTVVIVKDASNYRRYSGATWTDASPDTISLSSATLEGSAGTLSDSDAVTVYASLPSAPLAHNHSSNKLAQANTHESADTDSSTSSLHHTIGTGATNAAAGNHTHAEYRKTGSYYHGGCVAGTPGTTTASAADTITAYPFIVRSTWVIDGIRAYVNNAAAAGKKYRVALYSDNGSYRPGSIISGTDSAEGAADSVASTLFTFSNTTLSPGVYWAAFLSDGAPTMKTMSINMVEPLLGCATSTLSPYIAVSGSATYGSMPSTFPTPSLSSTGSPVLAMRTV